MEFRNMKYSRVNSFLFGTALGAGLIGTPAFSQVQDAASADTSGDLEEVVVTGSRIPRKDIVANSPTTVVSAAEISLASVVEIDRILDALPQTVGSNGPSTNNPGSGTATVDLRNLGTNRTLVLVNGRRFIGSSTTGVVDLNNIPPALIERIEVVTGGASAVYGSDAMAGVVNFILKDNFEGFQVGGQYGITERGDSQRYNIDFSLGTDFADGRGNVVISGNYFKRVQTSASERKFSEVAFAETTDGNGNPIFAPGGSTTVLEGRFNSNTLDNLGVLDTFGTAIGSLGVIATDDGSARAFSDPEDRYNFAPDNALQLPLERWNISGMGNYQLTDQINWFAEMTFTNSTINRQLAATPFSESGFQFSLANPHMPGAFRDVFEQMDTDGDGVVTSGIRRRMLEVGPRIETNTRNMWRVVTGLNGDVGDGLQWELFYNYGRSEETQRQQNNISISKYQQGLLVDPSDPTKCLDPSGGCVVMNPFGAGTITEDMANWVRVTASNLTTVEQQQLAANIAGDVFDLPAGAVGMAVGAEYRKETASQFNDSVLNSGDIDGFSGGKDTVGSYDVKEVYLETIIPILSDMAGAQYFGIEAGIRYSDYSTAGGVTSYKIGGEWRPVTDVKVRGLYQRAVRAPNVQELFLGSSNTFPSATDFCDTVRNSNRTDVERSFCIALGIPEANIDTHTQDNIQIESLVGGNPNLHEETSDTWSVGLVYTPDAVPGLLLSADLYSIKIDEAIAQFGGGLQSTIDACQNALDLSDPFCSVLSNARDAEGTLVEVSLLNQNIASREVKGIDFAASYGFEALDGDIDLNVMSSRLLEYKIQGSPLLEASECAGAVGVRTVCGRANPLWRASARATYSRDAWRASIKYRFIGAVTDERVALGSAGPSDLFRPNIGAQHYFDATVSYDVMEDMTLYATIDNLFDNDPPLIGDASRGNFNTDAGTYDVLGRRISLGFRAKF